MKLPATLLFAIPLLLLASCQSPGTGETAGKEGPRISDPVSYSNTGAGSMIEGKRTVTGRLVLQEDSRFGYPTIVTSSGEKIEASLYDEEKVASKIDPSQEYQFELLTRIFDGPYYRFDDISKVSKDGVTVIDSSICRLHKVPMLRRIIDSCDESTYPKSFFPVRDKQFPNDGNEYLRCGSGLRHPTWKCPECGRRYSAWAKRNGNDPNW